MVMQRCTKESFAVIGKLGSTNDGEGFIAKLWEEANAHFEEVSALAKRDENGNLCGVWGAMSDRSGAFQPWEDGFTQGLYLAGVECELAVEAPQGWTKWVIPAYDYLVAVNDQPDAFTSSLHELTQTGFMLAGAVHEYTCPSNGISYLYFPIQKRL